MNIPITGLLQCLNHNPCVHLKLKEGTDCHVLSSTKPRDQKLDISSEIYTGPDSFVNSTTYRENHSQF